MLQHWILIILFHLPYLLEVVPVIKAGTNKHNAKDVVPEPSMQTKGTASQPFDQPNDADCQPSTCLGQHHCWGQVHTTNFFVILEGCDDITRKRKCLRNMYDPVYVTLCCFHRSDYRVSCHRTKHVIIVRCTTKLEQIFLCTRVCIKIEDENTNIY